MRRFVKKAVLKQVVVWGVLIAEVSLMPVSAWASVPNNSVTTRKIRDHAVTSAKLRNGSVTNGRIANDAVGTAKLRNQSVTTEKIALLAITTALLGNDSVTSAKIADGAVATADIADDAITTAKIAAGAVGTTDIADSAVTTAKINGNAVTTAKIDTDAITNAKLATDSVNTTEIVNGAVTNAKLGTNVLVLRLGAGYVAQDTLDTSTFNFSSSYTTGGQSVDPTFTVIRSVTIVPSKGGYVFELDETSFSAGSFKVKAMRSPILGTPGAPLAEATAGVDLSAILTNIRFQVIGQ